MVNHLLLRCLPLWALLVFAAVPVPAGASFQERRTVTFGVLLDGPGGNNAAIQELLIREVRELSDRDFDLRFPEELILVGDWTVNTIERNLDRLFNDAEVDLVMAMGVIASQIAIDRAELAKPVIAAFAIDSELQQQPTVDIVQADGRAARASGRPNLSYLVSPWDTRRDLAAFAEIVAFEKVGILVDANIYDAMPALRQGVTGLFDNAGYQYQILPVRGDIQAALATLDNDVDAVLVGIMLNLPPASADALVAGLIERRLPSFAVGGRPAVQRGFLVGLAPESNLQRLVRRAAIHVQRILLGEDAGQLPVDVRQSLRLTFNMATARAIGFSPRFDLLTEAEVFGDIGSPPERQVTLADVVREARAANLELRAAQRAVLVSEQVVERARSAWLPQLGVGTAGTVVDSTQGVFQGGQFAWTGSAGLSQLILADGARAQVTIADEARKVETDSYPRLGWIRF